MMGTICVSPKITLQPEDLAVRRSRSSGPGGQNVNKVETKIELVFMLDKSGGLEPAVKERLRKLAGGRINCAGELVITSQKTRSQVLNLEDAREKLAYDLYYVKNRGLPLDLLILLSTVRVILFREGAR